MIYDYWINHRDFPLRAVAVLTTFVLTMIALKLLAKKLPRDHGREFAVNGELSQGKPRGAGIILISVFTLCAALFSKINTEQLINLGLIFAAMMTGYLDDSAKEPWGELKKGLCDLAIAGGITANFIYHRDTILFIFDKMFKVPVPLFAVLSVILVWVSINVVNCTDGVDGLCGSLCMATIFFLLQAETFYMEPGFIMLGVLAAYLWFNSSPSSLLMGDAGSRALGVFIALMSLQTAEALIFIPFAFVMIVDGGLGLFKLAVIRTFKKKNFMSRIRTPIHDHCRKEWGFSDSQVVTRFVMLQLVICTVVLFII
ncbi:MAG: phospho-N-acetylmuramoyl-pentapeptide-transferase [Ruminococcus sp.]|nr:phospho-N-acetylmuramoyl-pentapeptide-transferase [Ruminococcus sp.]